MKKQRIHKDKPIGVLTPVKDFLPPPDQLVFPDRSVKVTLLLNESSVDFFKFQAKKNKAKYQTMIRSLLDSYVRAYSTK